MSQDLGAKSAPLYQMGFYPVVPSKTRIPHSCDRCKQHIRRGAFCYRPLTNRKERGLRWCLRCVKECGTHIEPVERP